MKNRPQNCLFCSCEKIAISLNTPSCAERVHLDRAA